MSAIFAIARLRSRSAKGILRRCHWLWAPFVLIGLLVGPCAAEYAALEESVAAPHITGINGSWDGHEHGHSHHPGHRHVHNHEHQAGSSHHPTTIDDGCCFEVKAGTSASGKSSPEPEPPSHVVMVTIPVTATWLAPPSLRTAFSAVDRSQLHQTSQPVVLVTRRIRH